jgi:hypothetical protein
MAYPAIVPMALPTDEAYHKGMLRSASAVGFLVYGSHVGTLAINRDATPLGSAQLCGC